MVGLYLTQSRPRFLSVKLGSFRLSWLQLERSLDSAASSALLIDRPAQKHRTEAEKWRRRFKGFKRKAFEGF